MRFACKSEWDRRQSWPSNCKAFHLVGQGQREAQRHRIDTTRTECVVRTPNLTMPGPV